VDPQGRPLIPRGNAVGKDRAPRRDTNANVRTGTAVALNDSAADHSTDADHRDDRAFVH
jgi:hypothetical protein